MALNNTGNRGKRRGARAVSELVGPLLDPVIEKRAGLSMDLLAMWEQIAGPANAPFSRPEKLDWPRRASQGGNEPATLVIACDAARALFITHDGDTIVARVNAYFGYRAVARIRIVQKPITPAVQPVRRKLRKPTPISSDARDLLAQVEDDGLREALERLGRGVFRPGSSSQS